MQTPRHAVTPKARLGASTGAPAHGWTTWLFSKFSRCETVLLHPIQFCPLEQAASLLCDTPNTDVSPLCSTAPGPRNALLPNPSQLAFLSSSGVKARLPPGPGILSPAFQAAESTGNRPHVLLLPRRTKSHVNSCQDKEHLLCVEDTAVSHGAPGRAQWLVGGNLNRKLVRGAGCYLRCKEGIGVGEEVTCIGVQWQIISKPRPKRKSSACKRCVFTTQPMTGSIGAAASGTFYAI